MASSSVITRGGSRRMLSSLPEARMLVSFFPLATLTSMSPGREFSPTIIPSYTGVPGSMKKVERSCRFPSENATASPLTMLT